MECADAAGPAGTEVCVGSVDRGSPCPAHTPDPMSSHGDSLGVAPLTSSHAGASAVPVGASEGGVAPSVVAGVGTGVPAKTTSSMPCPILPDAAPPHPPLSSVRHWRPASLLAHGRLWRRACLFAWAAPKFISLWRRHRAAELEVVAEPVSVELLRGSPPDGVLTSYHRLRMGLGWQRFDYSRHTLLDVATHWA